MIAVVSLMIYLGVDKFTLDTLKLANRAVSIFTELNRYRVVGVSACMLGLYVLMIS